jgi:hypothetical protein
MEDIFFDYNSDEEIEWLFSVLRRMISHYLSINSRESLHTLSDSIGIDRHFLIKITEPQLDNNLEFFDIGKLYGIINFFNDFKKIKDPKLKKDFQRLQNIYISKLRYKTSYSNEIKKEINKKLHDDPQTVCVQEEMFSPLKNRVLSFLGKKPFSLNFTNMMLVHLSSLTNGVSLDMIQSLLGEYGEKRAFQMVEEGHLAFLNDHFYLMYSEYAFPLEMLTIFGGWLVHRFSNNAHFGKKRSIVAYTVASVNAEAFDKLYKSLLENIGKSYDLINNPKHHGDIPVGFYVFFDALIEDLASKGYNPGHV